MAFSTRANGSGEDNRIQASWFNDFNDWFLGVMVDQPITPKSRITNTAQMAAPVTGPSAALTAGTNMGIGSYKYKVSFTNDVGSTQAGPTTTIATTSGNQAVNLTSIPTGGAGTTKRTVWRTKVGGTKFYVLTTITDNTTTSYGDIKADTALTVEYDGYATAGAIECADENGVVKAAMGPNGQVRATKFFANPQTSHGQEPTLDITLGDDDTGLKWVSDGVFDLYANGVAILRIAQAGATISSNPVANVSGGSGRIFIQSTAPASPQDGDIWIDTSIDLG